MNKAKFDEINNTLDLKPEDLMKYCSHCECTHTKITSNKVSKSYKSSFGYKSDGAFICKKCKQVVPVAYLSAKELIRVAGSLHDKSDILADRFKFLVSCKSEISDSDIAKVSKLIELANSMDEIYKDCEDLIEDLAMYAPVIDKPDTYMHSRFIDYNMND